MRRPAALPSRARAGRRTRAAARALAAALLAVAALPAHAQIDAETRAARAAPLLDRLATIRSPAAAHPVVMQVWRIWNLGPTAEATETLDIARRRLRTRDYAGALALLGPLTERHPEFAEAWNQKAFAHFLRGELDASLEDIERVLELEPRHFGALGGRTAILMRQGRVRLGRKVLREALGIHPCMPERDMLGGDVPREEI